MTPHYVPLSLPYPSPRRPRDGSVAGCAGRNLVAEIITGEPVLSFLFRSFPVGIGGTFDAEDERAALRVDAAVAEVRAHAENRRFVFVGSSFAFVAGGELQTVGSEDLQRVA